MTVKEIVINYLKENNFDGLFDEDHCACLLEDLIPCNNDFLDCEAGYKVPCDGTCYDGHCDFHVASKKSEYSE